MTRALSWRHGPWTALKLGVALIYAFIVGPILITAIVSFNAVNRSQFPPQGFSLRWWGEAFTPQWLGPLAFSLELSTVTALISTALGLPLAFALARHEFPGRGVLAALTMSPLILPTLVTGIALLQFLQIAGFGALLGFWALLIGHVVICLPFSVRTVAISLKAMPPSVEQAALNLGAPPATVLREITIPLCKAGIFAGAVFAFIHSFSDVNLSLFVARPGQRPVTVTILSFLEYGFAPTLAAVSIITLVIPLVFVAVVERFVGVGDFVFGDHSRD
jgi:putative spermidine/putrescine transport system permease protein